MPQMAPISWLLLFLVFTITFIMFNILNYYSFFYSPMSSSMKKSSTQPPFNWKW